MEYDGSWRHNLSLSDGRAGNSEHLGHEVIGQMEFNLHILAKLYQFRSLSSVERNSIEPLQKIKWEIKRIY